MVVKRPPGLWPSQPTAHCWHQVSVRSVKHWPAQARRVNGVLAISVPGSGARAWHPCGHSRTRDSLWLHLIHLRYHRVLELFMTEAEKLSFVLTTMRCEEVESILTAWPLPRHSINPSLLPALELLKTQTRMEEERRKGTGPGIVLGIVFGHEHIWWSCSQIFRARPWPDTKWGESSETTPCRQLALSKLLIVFLCFMRILFVWTNLRI